MRRIFVFLSILFLTLLVACGNGDNEGNEEGYTNELTENEKLGLNIDREKDHLEDIYELVDELEIQETKETDTGTTIERYDPAEFAGFIMPEAGVTQVVRAISDEEEYKEVVSLMYQFRDRHVIVDYFNSGEVHKMILQGDTGYVLVNENDENFSKFHRDEIKD